MGIIPITDSNGGFIPCFDTLMGQPSKTSDHVEMENPRDADEPSASW